MRSARAALSALVVAALAATAVVLPGCSDSGTDLVIYSGRNEQLIKPILDEFAEREKLNVEVRFADTADLTATVLEEGDNARADVFIGQDAGSLQRLAEAGRLQRYDGAQLARVPAKFKDPDSLWTGLSARVRVIMVNRGELPRAQWPDSVFELTDPRWKGKVAGPNSTNVSWVDFVSEMRIKRGDDFTRRWLEGMKANDLELLGSHTDVRNAVSNGEFQLGLVNHYYVKLAQRDGAPVDAIFPDQRPRGFGTPINAASGGIIAGAEHSENAKKLLDFLLEPNTQAEFAGRNFEYPVLPGVPAPGLRPLDTIRDTGVPLTALGSEQEPTQKMLDEVGLGD